MSDNHYGRRIALKAIGLGAAGSAMSLLARRTAFADNKSTKATAGYIAKPGPGGADCSSCVNYIPTGSMCMVVQGSVAATGYCNFYAPKS
ncbi:MAG: hypothetical protein ACP5M1_03105 [Acidiphilium sp.]|jgi:hypothetical protein